MDAQDREVLLRIIIARNLINVMVPPASGQKRRPVSERFRSRWIHSQLSSAGRFSWFLYGREGLSS